MFKTPVKAQLKHVALLFAGCMLLTGCIPVKNVEKAWKQAKADQALVGTWAQGDSGMVGFVNTDKGYLVTSGTSGLEGGCRSVTTNGHQYLIVAKFRAAILGFDQVDDDVKDGTLMRYTLEDDTLTLYTFDQEKLNTAIKDKKVSGEMDENDSGKLLELDADTLKWLGEIADDQDGWDEQVYTRK